MKKGLFCLSMLALAFQAFGGRMIELSNISCQGKKIIPFTDTEKFFEADFSADSDVWDRAKSRNYNNLITMKFGANLAGETCLMLEGGEPRKQTDTAWVVESKPIPYKGGACEYAVDVRGSASYDISGIAGQSYNSFVTWFNAEKQPINKQNFKLIGSNGRFTWCRSFGTVPENAASYTISIGFDSPNIDPGQYAAFSKVQLGRIPSNANYIKETWFTTDSYQLDGNDISWEADAPSGTAMKFQISTADDANGIPGKWSEFHGPDGTVNTTYDKPFKVNQPWLRLKVILASTAKAYPLLKSIKIGSVVENKWMATAEHWPPLIENLTVSPTLNRRQDIVLRVSGISPIVWNSLKAKIDGVDVTKAFTRDKNILTYKADKDYSDGIHKIEVTLSNLAGFTNNSEKYLLIGEGPKVDKITIRDDGMTLINGKPFFPIGAYAVCKREFNDNNLDKALMDLKEGGFNFVHTYSGAQVKELLDCAQKYGFRAWIGERDPMGKAIRQFKYDHPALLAWYIGDDTSGHTTPEKLQDLHDALHAIDDKRITTQADGVGAMKPVSSYHDFVRATDNFLPEIYPVRVDTPEDRASCVAKVVNDMKVIYSDIDDCGVPHPKSIWSIIQYFQGWSGWKRFPEENEIRAMTFASVIHGATGVTWYTYGGFHEPKKNRTNYGITSTPERWRIITTIAKQLNELSPVLTERTPEQPAIPNVVSGAKLDSFGNPSVTCLLKIHEGKTYVLAVNSTLDTIEAEIQLKKLSKATVLFEDRELKLEKSVLKDTYKPYDVHIYKLD